MFKFKYNKILFSIFIILTLIVVGEFCYYVYFQLSQKNKYLQCPTVERTAFSNIVSTPPPTPSISLPPVENQALNDATVMSLKYLRKGALTSAILITRYRGKIIELDKSGGLIPNFNKDKRYKIKLIVKGKNETASTFYFSEIQVRNIKVIERINGEEIPSKLDDLHIDDKIILEVTTDLTKELNYDLLGFKIVKI